MKDVDTLDLRCYNILNWSSDVATKYFFQKERLNDDRLEFDFVE